MTNTYNWLHRKFTDAQADEIRKQYAAGNITMRELAVQFHCGEMTIHRIVRNKFYRYPNPLKK